MEKDYLRTIVVNVIIIGGIRLFDKNWMGMQNKAKSTNEQKEQIFSYLLSGAKK